MYLAAVPKATAAHILQFGTKSDEGACCFRVSKAMRQVIPTVLSAALVTEGSFWVHTGIS